MPRWWPRAPAPESWAALFAVDGRDPIGLPERALVALVDLAGDITLADAVGAVAPAAWLKPAGGVGSGIATGRSYAASMVGLSKLSSIGARGPAQATKIGRAHV